MTILERREEERMHADPHWTIQHTAMEIARVAFEGLGQTKLEELQTKFKQELQKDTDDPELQLQAVIRLLIKMTDARTGPKDTRDARIAGLCFLWLAHTRVSNWTLLQLYSER